MKRLGFLKWLAASAVALVLPWRTKEPDRFEIRYNGTCQICDSDEPITAASPILICQTCRKHGVNYLGNQPITAESGMHLRRILRYVKAREAVA